MCDAGAASADQRRRESHRRRRRLRRTIRWFCRRSTSLLWERRPLCSSETSSSSTLRKADGGGGDGGGDGVGGRHHGGPSSLALLGRAFCAETLTMTTEPKNSSCSASQETAPRGRKKQKKTAKTKSTNLPYYRCSWSVLCSCPSGKNASLLAQRGRKNVENRRCSRGSLAGHRALHAFFCCCCCHCRRHLPSRSRRGHARQHLERRTQYCSMFFEVGGRPRRAERKIVGLRLLCLDLYLDPGDGVHRLHRGCCRLFVRWRSRRRCQQSAPGCSRMHARLLFGCDCGSQKAESGRDRHPRGCACRVSKATNAGDVRSLSASGRCCKQRKCKQEKNKSTRKLV